MVPLLESALTVHTEGIINQLLLKVNGENYEGQYSHWTHHNGSRHTPGRLLVLCLSYLDFSVRYCIYLSEKEKMQSSKTPYPYSVSLWFQSMLFLYSYNKKKGIQTNFFSTLNYSSN